MNIKEHVVSAHLPPEHAHGAYPAIGLYIAGEWIYQRETHCEVRNPSTEDLLGCVPRATQQDLERALAAAEQGFRIWRDWTPEQRAQLLGRVVQLLREREQAIAHIITLEQGKPLADAKSEVARARSFLEWDAAQAMRSYGRVLPSGPQMQRSVVRVPVGPVAAFTPWNVPISAPARKLSSALAAGCSVIIKAAEETPATACAFVQCFIDAGLPQGVLNLVFGEPAEISAALIDSPVIRMVTLTGSVRVGKQLAQQAGAAMKPVVMELGGHGPVILDAGVNGAAIGQLAAAAKFRLAGQICASPTRFIVHRSVYADFVAAFAGAANALQVADGFASGVQMGPVINRGRLLAIEALVADALECGARLAAGGQRLGSRGCFYAPTVLADVPLEARAMHEEPFGPLALCIPVDDLDQALHIANSLPMGLSGYAFTNSLQAAERISRELVCGVISINHFGTPGADAPFGGVADSGMGREGGEESLDAYLVSKTVLQSTRPV